MKIVAVTNAQGAITEPALVAAAEEVHRQLRPHLPADYVGRLKEVFASGAEMAVAEKEGRVLGITVFRVMEKTFTGRELYCDDLVADERERSSGVGKALLDYLKGEAEKRGCDNFALSSGCQRTQAHRFYFREGLVIGAFQFSRKVKP
jgi:GNAT superfamily N-acetyltransferase